MIGLKTYMCVLEVYGGGVRGVGGCRVFRAGPVVEKRWWFVLFFSVLWCPVGLGFCDLLFFVLGVRMFLLMF